MFHSGIIQSGGGIIILENNPMVTSISEREPQVSDGASTLAGESVRLTVTGLDENGQMFREAAPILNLNGRDCSFRSKFQPEVGSWMLVEIDLTKQGLKRSTLQGQVRSVQAEGVSTNLFQVRVELEAAQEVKIVATPRKAEGSAPESAPKPISEVNIESDGAPKGVSAAEPKTEPMNEAVTEPVVTPVVRASASEDRATVEVPLPAQIKQNVPPQASAESLTPAQPVQIAAFDRDAAKSAIASEVKEQLAALKETFGKELEQMAERPVSSNMEQIIRQAIEKQISVSYQSAIQTLNSDLTYQLMGRIAGSDELRSCIEKMAKGILEDQIASSRNSAIEAQQNLNAHVTEITRTFEASMADMEGRLKIARDSATAVLDRVQSLEREAANGTLSLQKTVEQLNQAARSTIEKFDVHITAQLNSWSAQFKKHLDEVSREKSAQCATDLQQQLAASRKDANDVVEKLSAGMQLARGTLRLQEEQLTGLSRTAAAEFEKEIKAILIRLANSV
jgi:hypothetical protein